MVDIAAGDEDAILAAVSDALGKVSASTSDNDDNKEVPPLSLSTRLRDDLGLDSFAALELLFEIEDRAGIRIPQEIAVKFATVGDVVAFIRETLATRGQDTGRATEAAR